MKTIALIGYSGHAFVAFDCFFTQGQIITAYCDTEEKKINPFGLRYLGNESDSSVLATLINYDYFVAIGDNQLRRKITDNLIQKIGKPVSSLHKSAILTRNMECGEGVMIAPRVIVNSLSKIGNGVILNSGCIIEHECEIGNFTHIAPGAVLCGGVKIGQNTLIGANSVVKPFIKIGNNVSVGAGSVIIQDVPDNTTVAGNPARKI